MALEIIKNIAEAEQKGDSIKNSALQEAEKLKAEADVKCREVFSDARREAKKAAEGLISKAVESAQGEVESILSQAENKCAQISEKAAQNMSAAVEAVIGKVVGTDGNS